MDTLAFGYILPTTGRIPDLHRLETCAARRTRKNGRTEIISVRLFYCPAHFVQWTNDAGVYPGISDAHVEPGLMTTQ